MKNIAVIPNNIKDTELVCTEKVLSCLKGKAQIYMEKNQMPNVEGINHVSYDRLFETADIVVVLGGDGTILQSALPCAKHNTPMLGVNLGRVGFMSEVEIDELQTAIEKVICDDYVTEKRMMMEISIKRNGVIENVVHALNDVVVSKSSDCKLIGMELYTDGELMNKYVADGLIIATPTGSTGYSISAGGPVVDPVMNLFIATPICAHMLSARSAVLSAEKELNIKIDGTYASSEAVLMADGDRYGYIKTGDEVVVTKSKYHMDLIRVNKKSFYDTLISKLA